MAYTNTNNLEFKSDVELMKRIYKDVPKVSNAHEHVNKEFVNIEEVVVSDSREDTLADIAQYCGIADALDGDRLPKDTTENPDGNLEKALDKTQSVNNNQSETDINAQTPNSGHKSVDTANQKEFNVSKGDVLMAANVHELELGAIEEVKQGVEVNTTNVIDLLDYDIVPDLVMDLRDDLPEDRISGQNANTNTHGTSCQSILDSNQFPNVDVETELNIAVIDKENTNSEHATNHGQNTTKATNKSKQTSNTPHTNKDQRAESISHQQQTSYLYKAMHGDLEELQHEKPSDPKEKPSDPKPVATKDIQVCKLTHDIPAKISELKKPHPPLPELKNICKKLFEQMPTAINIQREDGSKEQNEAIVTIPIKKRQKCRPSNIRPEMDSPDSNGSKRRMISSNNSGDVYKMNMKYIYIDMGTSFDSDSEYHQLTRAQREAYIEFRKEAMRHRKGNRGFPNPMRPRNLIRSPELPNDFNSIPVKHYMNNSSQLPGVHNDICVDFNSENEFSEKSNNRAVIDDIDEDVPMDLSVPKVSQSSGHKPLPPLIYIDGIDPDIGGQNHQKRNESQRSDTVISEHLNNFMWQKIKQMNDMFTCSTEKICCMNNPSAPENPQWNGQCLPHERIMTAPTGMTTYQNVEGDTSRFTQGGSVRPGGKVRSKPNNVPFIASKYCKIPSNAENAVFQPDPVKNSMIVNSQMATTPVKTVATPLNSPNFAMQFKTPNTTMQFNSPNVPMALNPHNGTIPFNFQNATMQLGPRNGAIPFNVGSGKMQFNSQNVTTPFNSSNENTSFKSTYGDMRFSYSNDSPNRTVSFSPPDGIVPFNSANERMSFNSTNKALSFDPMTGTMPVILPNTTFNSPDGNSIPFNPGNGDIPNVPTNGISFDSQNDDIPFTSQNPTMQFCLPNGKIPFKSSNGTMPFMSPNPTMPFSSPNATLQSSRLMTPPNTQEVHVGRMDMSSMSFSSMKSQNTNGPIHFPSQRPNSLSNNHTNQQIPPFNKSNNIHGRFNVPMPDEITDHGLNSNYFNNNPSEMVNHHIQQQNSPNQHQQFQQQKQLQNIHQQVPYLHQTDIGQQSYNTRVKSVAFRPDFTRMNFQQHKGTNRNYNSRPRCSIKPTQRKVYSKQQHNLKEHNKVNKQQEIKVKEQVQNNTSLQQTTATHQQNAKSQQQNMTSQQQIVTSQNTISQQNAISKQQNVSPKQPNVTSKQQTVILQQQSPKSTT
ncbi:unnamed protein product [Owenia fusiformis]|uniref:Uncharacterized protein n=1 Tax=Owenia fusiformis TaxID=6347 RepID=A0A8J1T6X0_OWEFU|nr:unnamed protein product [Owenia fusiformis]